MILTFMLAFMKSTVQTDSLIDSNQSIAIQMTVSHLESHRDSYMEFLCDPFASDDPNHTDTEPADEEDVQITQIENPDDRSRARWNKYLPRLRNGAWGDHLCVAAMANMFSVTINVFTATGRGCAVNAVTPLDDNSIFEVNIGLIMQNHYVGLDRINIVDDSQSDTPMVVNLPPNTQCTDNPGSTSAGIDDQSPNTFDSPIDDKTFEEGDEHTRQITGGPSTSMMSIENPEAFAEIVCVAPAESQKPLFIMTDPNFEAMSNPEKFPHGTGCYSSDRPHKLTYRKYFNKRLLDVDGRFARDTDYLFVAQYIVESKQILDDCNHFVWRQKPGRDFTARQAKDPSFIRQCLRKDKAYRFMKNIRGSPPYYQRTFYELLAMIRQLGTPTWFFTLSAADMKWPDIIQTIARQYGVVYTDEQVAALSFDEKSGWIRRNPVTAARHFQYRLNTFFNEFLKSPAKPLGEVEDYGIRIEFQARGSPHAHCVLWIKDAPKYDENSSEDVCKFIDQYITCSIPEVEGKLKELVLQLQNHRHSSYCKRNNSCRFGFPHPPSDNTLIAEPCEPCEHSTDPIETLKKSVRYLQVVVVMI